MERKSHSPLDATQEANLRRYAALGIGTAVLAGAVTTADASVVFTNFNNTVLTDTIPTDETQTDWSLFLANNGTFSVVNNAVGGGGGTNVLNFSIATLGANNAKNFAEITAGMTGGAVQPLNFVGTSAVKSSFTFFYPSRLAMNSTVGPSNKFVTISTGASGSLIPGTLAYGPGGFAKTQWGKAGTNSGYLGISFLGTDNATHYAFVQLTVTPNDDPTNARAITLGVAGYETTAGTTITAVPEPTSLALLAAGGAGGIAAFRRRKKAEAAARAEAEV